MVEAFVLKSHSLSTGEAVTGAGWAVNKGVVTYNGGTLLCFSMEAPAAGAHASRGSGHRAQPGTRAYGPVSACGATCCHLLQAELTCASMPLARTRQCCRAVPLRTDATALRACA